MKAKLVKALCILSPVIIAWILVGTVILSEVSEQAGIILYAREVTLDNDFFNVTFDVVKAPEYGFVVSRVSALYTFQEFTPFRLYTNDSMTFYFKHEGLIRAGQTYFTLHGPNWSIDLLLKEGETYEV